MRHILILAAAAALAGCSTAGKFDNLLLTSLDGDRAFVASTYGPFGLTQELREADARQLQKLRELAAMPVITLEVPAPAPQPKLGRTF